MTKLEKMKMIYDKTGIEPANWWGRKCSLTANIDSISATKQGDNIIPYYSESQLWKMIPKYITNQNIDFELYFSAACDLQNLGYRNSHGPRVQVNIAPSLHEALLDMVLWCVNEGHIKRDDE